MTGWQDPLGRSPAVACRLPAVPLTPRGVSPCPPWMQIQEVYQAPKWGIEQTLSFMNLELDSIYELLFNNRADIRLVVV